MSNITKGVIIGAGLWALCLPSMAADYSVPSDIRGGYNAQWNNSDMDSAVGFEIGMRYWYSIGAHAMTVGADSYSADDTSHIVELFARIDDKSTNGFLDANIGYGAITNGSYSTPSGTGVSSVSQVAYAGADYGMLPFGAGPFAFGGFGGYKYMKESVDQGFAGQSIDINSLRLGLAGKAEFGDTIEANFKAAFIPFAWVSGEYASYNLGAGGTIAGALYGAEAEANLSMNVTDNVALSLGARASYLMGPADIAGTPVDSLSFARGGLLAGVSGKF